MSRLKKFIKGINKIFDQVALGGETSSDGSDAGLILLGDKNISTVARNKYITGIGYAAGTEGVATWAETDGITAYRVKCSAECRIVEDPMNLAQAQAWLNVEAPEAAGDINYIKVPADTWSEWQLFPEGYSLSSIYISLNAAGVDATATVEAK